MHRRALIIAVAALAGGTRLVETVGLGHGRILRDPATVEETVAFVGAGA